MSGNYQQPGIANPEDKFVPADNNGALLLFFPKEYREGVKTEHGEANTVAAKIVRLNDGRVFNDALIFSTALVTQLKGAIPDGMVLGTLGQGENKRGNPPWLLRPHTEAEVAQADAWIAANPVNQFAQPPAQSGPPTPPAWGAPATPAAPAWGGQASAPAAPAQQGGWGAPAPAAPSAAPQAPSGWGQQPQPAPAAPQAGWNQPAPQAPAAPAAANVDPALVAALAAKGIQLQPHQTQADAESIWHIVSAQG